MLVLQRVTFLAGLSLLAFACGEEFTGVEQTSAGASGATSAGTWSGSDTGGQDATDGGGETGGTETNGGSVAGRGGVTSVSGSSGKGGGSGGKGSDGGSGGSGGSVVVSPQIPVEGLELWFDASGLGEGTFDVPALAARESVFIGHSLYASCQDFAGKLSELIVYNRPVSDAELIDIESYLQEKWACCSE